MQGLSGHGLHWFDPFGSVDINNLCNCPPVDGTAQLRIVFWDQEPVYRSTATKFMDQFVSQYQGPCLLITSEQDSEDLEWVKNTYKVDSAYYFFHGWAALDWYRGYNHSFLIKPWHQRRLRHRIFCANNIISGMRQHRTRLFVAMHQHGLLENNMISFPSHCPFSDESAADICRSMNLPVPDVALPLIIDGNRNHAAQSHKIDFWQQAEPCFCHVVTETVFDNRLHLTEKTFKPIVMQQPFVMVGPKHSLRYLKHYGFKTFDSIWDESYDQLNDQDRLAAVTKLLSEINSWDDQQINHAQQQIAEVVQHNYHWFYNEFQHVLWQELVSMIDLWR